MALKINEPPTTDAATDGAASPRLPTDSAPASSSSNNNSTSHSNSSMNSSSSSNKNSSSSNCSSSHSGGGHNTDNSTKNIRTSRSKDSSSSSSSSSEDGSMKAWTQEMEDVMVRVCLRTLDYSTRKDLERRVRSGTGTEDKASQGCCSQQQQQQQQGDGCCSKHGSHQHSHPDASADPSKSAATAAAAAAGPPPAAAAAAASYSFCKDETDDVGRRLDDWTSAERLRSVVGAVYGLSVEKGDADDHHLHDTIVKEALLRELQLRIAQEACVSGYQDGPLSFLRPETIRDLMVEGVAVQDGFIGEEMRGRALKELELLDFDGRFNEVGEGAGFMTFAAAAVAAVHALAAAAAIAAVAAVVLMVVVLLVFRCCCRCCCCCCCCFAAAPAVLLLLLLLLRCCRELRLGGLAFGFKTAAAAIAALAASAAAAAAAAAAVSWRWLGLSAEDGGELLVYRRRGRREQLENAESICVPESEQPIKRITPMGDRLVLLSSRNTHWPSTLTACSSSSSNSSSSSRQSSSCAFAAHPCCAARAAAAVAAAAAAAAAATR
ncbi:hypothetical protein Emag_002040 [Eimeria magna]